MTRTRKVLLSAGVAGVVLIVLLCVLLTRPTVRANRLCRDAGFGRLPDGAQDVRIGRRGPAFTTQSLYLRFQTTVEEAASFFQRSGIDPNDPNQEPGSMQIVRFSDKSPPWMQWADPINGRIYHIDRQDASVWLAIDDDSHTIYVAMHERRPAWLRRLMERFGLL